MGRTFWVLSLLLSGFCQARETEPSHFQLGPSFTVMDYNQTGSKPTTQMWLGLDGKYVINGSESWKIIALANLAALPLSKTGTPLNLRTLGGSVRSLYEGWNHEGEGVFPSFGYQYQTTINKDRFGYRNIHGPTLGAQLRFNRADKKQIGIEQSFGIFVTDSSFTLGNSELLLKIFYSLGGSEGWWSRAVFSLQASRLSLGFQDGEVGAYFYSLNLSGAF